MKQTMIGIRNHWRNGAWIAAVGAGLILSACSTSPLQGGCDERPQILETSAPWGNSCDQTSHNDPLDNKTEHLRNNRNS